MIKLEKRSLDSIHPYKRNPRINDGAAVEAVKESIKQCTYVAPIVVDENGEILAGHTHYKALRSLGYEEAEVVVKEGLTEQQKKKYRILDNRTNELAGWDFEKLLEEIEDVDFEGYDFGIDSINEELTKKIEAGFEYSTEDFSDEQFKHECPECGFKFN